MEIHLYPGAAGSYLLYEDDGRSFNYRQGQWMGIQMTWNDVGKTLSLRLANGSRLLGPPRKMVVKLGKLSRSVTFDGKPLEVKFNA